MDGLTVFMFQILFIAMESTLEYFIEKLLNLIWFFYNWILLMSWSLLAICCFCMSNFRTRLFFRLLLSRLLLHIRSFNGIGSLSFLRNMLCLFYSDFLLSLFTIFRPLFLWLFEKFLHSLRAHITLRHHLSLLFLEPRRAITICYCCSCWLPSIAAHNRIAMADSLLHGLRVKWLKNSVLVHRPLLHLKWNPFIFFILSLRTIRR